MRAAIFAVLAGRLAFTSAQLPSALGFTSTDATYNLTTEDFTFNVNWTSTVDTCVSPVVFNQCQLNATNLVYQPCLSKCPAANTTAAAEGYATDFGTCWEKCACELYTHQINCALEYCWNRVYGCEYQKTAYNLVTICGEVEIENPSASASTTASASATSSTSVSQSIDDVYSEAGVPYFPAPADAPGACSCNLVSAFEAVTLVFDGAENCAGGEDNTDPLLNETCGCCAYSGAYSAFYQVCPDTSAQDIGIDWFFHYSTLNFTSSQCGSSPVDTCVSGHGFYALPDNSTSYSAYSAITSASAKATGTLSDLQGQITSPASGYTVTWTANNTPHTITATSTTVKPESSSSAGSTATGSAASKASGSATSSTSKSAATGRIEIEAGVVAVGLIAVMVGL